MLAAFDPSRGPMLGLPSISRLPRSWWLRSRWWCSAHSSITRRCRSAIGTNLKRHSLLIERSNRLAKVFNWTVLGNRSTSLTETRTVQLASGSLQ